MNLAVITARGGSKRIPRKNILPFCGKPIIEYSIEAALGCGLFDEVMVSTDDKEIAAIAQKAGAEVPFLRSESNAGDYATTADVLQEVIEKYAEKRRIFTYTACIYPTAPFVTATKLKQALLSLEKKGASALVPVVAFSFPPLRGFEIAGGSLKYKWPEYERTRSQDIPSLYHDSGQFYIVKTSDFLIEKTLVCKNTIPFILPEAEVQDIDTLEDWKLAEMKYKQMLEKQAQEV